MKIKENFYAQSHVRACYIVYSYEVVITLSSLTFIRTNLTPITWPKAGNDHKANHETFFDEVANKVVWNLPPVESQIRFIFFLAYSKTKHFLTTKFIPRTRTYTRFLFFNINKRGWSFNFTIIWYFFFSFIITVHTLFVLSKLLGRHHTFFFLEVFQHACTAPSSQSEYYYTCIPNARFLFFHINKKSDFTTLTSNSVSFSTLLLLLYIFLFIMSNLLVITHFLIK